MQRATGPGSRGAEQSLRGAGSGADQDAVVGARPADHLDGVFHQSLAHGDTGDADVVKCILHIVELERLDDRFDLLHGSPAAAIVLFVMPNRRRIWKAGPH